MVWPRAECDPGRGKYRGPLHWFKLFGRESYWFRCKDHNVTSGTGTIYKGGLFALMAGHPDPERKVSINEQGVFHNEQESGFFDEIDWT